jgi:hypothetical protein
LFYSGVTVNKFIIAGSVAVILTPLACMRDTSGFNATAFIGVFMILMTFFVVSGFSFIRISD